MNFQHQKLADGDWQKLSFFEQMANLGSEVIRAIKWQNKNRLDYARLAADRALELLYLTNDDPRNLDRLAETTRLYELLVDYFYGQNIYKTDPNKLANYFLAFNYAARAGHAK